MKVQQIYTTCLSQGSYYIESNNEVAIIDPLREADIYISKAKSSNSKIKFIFETHIHADFISGHLNLAKKSATKYIPKCDFQKKMTERKNSYNYLVLHHNPLTLILLR